MVIVGGWFTVEPSEREAFIAGQAEAIRRSRAEQGCIEYVIAADPVEPGRAVLFERWASQADLDAHLAGLASAPWPENSRTGTGRGRVASFRYGLVPYRSSSPPTLQGGTRCSGVSAIPRSRTAAAG